MSQLVPSITPVREFKDYEDGIRTVAVFPDRRRMVTGSQGKTLRLWDLKTGVVLKKMEGHHDRVSALTLSRDGQTIASGSGGELIAWHGETGEPLIRAIKAHSLWIWSLDFSPDGTVLATGSRDGTTRLWNTESWRLQGNIDSHAEVNWVRYSPSGELLAVATDDDIQIYNSDTRESIANFKTHAGCNTSLAWTPNGTRLLSSVDDNHCPSIREWDTSTWKQVGDSWMGHTDDITAIAIHPAGTLVASASDDNHVRLWRLSDQQTIAIFKHSAQISCVTFSMDGKHIFSGGGDEMISQWEVPNVTFPEDTPRNWSRRLESLIQRHIYICDSDDTI